MVLVITQGKYRVVGQQYNMSGTFNGLVELMENSAGISDLRYIH